MNSMMPEKDFPYDKDTLVVLIARCAEGHAIIEQHGNHWVARPLPKQFQDANLKEVLRAHRNERSFGHSASPPLYLCSTVGSAWCTSRWPS